MEWLVFSSSSSNLHTSNQILRHHTKIQISGVPQFSLLPAKSRRRPNLDKLLLISICTRPRHLNTSLELTGFLMNFEATGYAKKEVSFLNCCCYCCQLCKSIFRHLMELCRFWEKPLLNTFCLFKKRWVEWNFEVCQKKITIGGTKLAFPDPWNKGRKVVERAC